MIEVIKFGGNTIKTYPDMIIAANYLKSKIEEKKKLIVVVSAMGRIGDPYATDTLRSLLTGDILPVEHDRLLACGEIISSIVFRSFLSDMNISSYSCSANEIGLITDEKHNNASIIDIEPNFYRIFEQYDCIVVPGFQGVTKKNVITTIGRGGSDISAIILGKFYSASIVEIISDVEGILTADPKIVSDAKLMKSINHAQLEEITKNGCSVLHHKAAKIALDFKVPMVFKSLKNPANNTKIQDNDDFFNITYQYFGKNNKVRIAMMINDETQFEEINLSDLSIRINQLHRKYSEKN
ncbi:hypothetical protein RI065_08790 [Mycoplasmatota bacterium zrk1]